MYFNNINYIKYAVGEVILVVIGILIALQVNNFNEIRIEKKAMKDYFQKIASNIHDDLKESERLLKFRQDHIISCNKASKSLIESNFSDQMSIQKAIFEMIIEVQLNYNKDAFESLKSSGYLRYLKNQKIEHTVDWRIIARSKAYNPTNDQCRLCNKEKYFIMFSPEGASLNARSEFYSSCRHKAKHLMGGKT